MMHGHLKSQVEQYTLHSNDNLYGVNWALDGVNRAPVCM